MNGRPLPRVFVVNQPLRFDRELGHLVKSPDLTPAASFGELVYLLPEGELRDTPEGIIETLTEKLQDFTSNDLLLLVGDPRAMAWAAVIAADRADGLLSLLHWVRSDSRYQIISSDLFPHEGEITEINSEPRNIGWSEEES